MAIPKPVRPEYTTTIPSSGKKVKYQPFTVKEEKILILAAEGGDTDEISNAITNVLERCITSPPTLNVRELALFDVEYLFLKARAKSVGEKLKVELTDPNDETYKVNHEIDVDKIKVKHTEGHSDTVELGDDMVVKFRYPDITFFEEGINPTDVDAMTSVVARCISQIVVGEEVYNRADMSDEELKEWVDSLSQKQFNDVSAFFETMPKLSHSFTLTNRNTGNKFTVKLEGLADFF